MKINKRYRPELVVSKGKEANPLLTDPYLDAKEERLVSTNGHGLVSLPVETEKTERSRYLACSLLEAARGFGDESLPAEIHDQEIVEFGVLWPTAQERTFPDWRKLMPKFSRGSPGTATLALSPQLLAKMAGAMGLGGVCLTFELGHSDDQPSPIVVQPLDPDAEEIGLLMPLGAAGSGEGIIPPNGCCPQCGKLLAPGAACPKHGDPAKAKLEKDADEILKNAGSGELTKKDRTITEITLKAGGRSITTTPEKLHRALDVVKGGKKGGRRG